MTTNYYTFGGTILAEEQAGGAGYRNYGPDALGSVVATYDSNGLLQNQLPLLRLRLDREARLADS